MMFCCCIGVLCISQVEIPDIFLTLSVYPDFPDFTERYFSRNSPEFKYLLG